MRPYFTDSTGTIQIFLGDCRDILPSIQADYVITSPPYNMGTSSGGGIGPWSNGKGMSVSALGDGYGSSGDSMPVEKYREWMKERLELMWRCVSESGAVFLNHKPRIQSGLAVLPTVYLPSEMPVSQVIVWNRGIALNFMPNRWASTSEWVIISAKSKFRLLSKASGRDGDVWTFPPELGQVDHPAPFPVELPSRIMRAVAPGVFVDPFSGSGSTLVAAKVFGLRAIGIEIEERYAEIAAKRLQQEAMPFDGPLESTARAVVQHEIGDV